MSRRSLTVHLDTLRESEISDVVYGVHRSISSSTFWCLSDWAGLSFDEGMTTLHTMRGTVFILSPTQFLTGGFNIIHRVVILWRLVTVKMARNEAQGELNLAWTSDLEDVEQPTSRTIGGTTEDDMHSEKTEWLPQDVDREELTEKQEQALKAYITHPKDDPTFAEVADGASFSTSLLRRTVHRYLGHDKEYSDFSETRREVIDAIALNPDASDSEVGDECGVSGQTVWKVKAIYSDVVESRREELQTDEPTNEELLEELRRIDEQLDRFPYASDMRSHDDFSQYDYTDRFGSWDNALEEAGVDKETELLTDMQSVVEQTGRGITQDDMNEHGKYSASAAARFFGSWANAKERLEDWEPETDGEVVGGVEVVGEEEYPSPSGLEGGGDVNNGLVIFALILSFVAGRISRRLF